MGGHYRFFVEPQNIDGGIATITGQTARQMSQVLRMREGDKVLLLDGTGCRYEARIVSFTKSEVKAEITDICGSYVCF
jgi:16S rRNA (uracil1498-N3)-methyltransferase